MKPVTDPGVLAELEGDGGAPKPVTDPAVLAQLEGKPAAPAKPPLPVSGGGPLEFTTGNIWKGAANLAGMPMDTMTNAMNLGRAGMGVATGNPEAWPVRSGHVGGSQWIQDLMRRAGLITPGAEPESTPGRYAASAIQMATGAGIPGAAMGRIAQPTRTMMNAPRAAAAGAASGVGAEAATDVYGEEAAPLGAMLPGMRGTKTPGERATAQRREGSFVKAKEMGIPIPPRAMKDDPVQQRLQDTANVDLRQPTGAPVTPEALKAYRGAHWKDYEAVIKDPSLAGGVKPSPAFQKTVQDIGDEVMRARTELPETFKTMQPVIKLLGEYGYAAMPPGAKQIAVPPRSRPIPPDVAMRAIRKLRDDADTNYRAEKPEQAALAGVQKKLAGALEDLIESNIQGNPQLMQNFRNARTSIAKSYDYENALAPETRQLSGGRMSSAFTGGSPLSGGARDIAEVAGAFPDAMRGGTQSDLFTHRMTPHTMLRPESALTHMLTRLSDPLTLSRPYQASMVDPRAKLTPEQARIMALLAAAQQGGGRIPAPPRSQ